MTRCHIRSARLEEDVRPTPPDYGHVLRSMAWLTRHSHLAMTSWLAWPPTSTEPPWPPCAFLHRPADTTLPPALREPDRLAVVAQDAAGLKSTGAAGQGEPRDESGLCTSLCAHPDTAVLPQGALTSLTGGATPSGEVVISTAVSPPPRSGARGL